MHGYGGSENSEKYMVKQAINKDVTKDAIVATVDNQGDVHFKGAISDDAQNPIVKVVFEDNKMAMLIKMLGILKMSYLS